MDKQTRTHIIWSVITAFFAIGGIALGYYLSFNKPVQTDFNRVSKENKLESLIRFIKEHYVDEVDIDSITDKVITGILSELDPHSVYIPRSESEQVQETMHGKFTGIGVEFEMDNDTFLIRRILPYSPAQKSGLKVYDRILAIDGDTIAGKNLSRDSIVTRLKGKAGTKVRLLVRRIYPDTTLQITVKRGPVPLQSVPAAFMINDTLGYIKISLFADNTHSEFIRALKKLKQQGMTALILDLRGNAGGYLKQANLIADEFLSSGNLIFYTVDHDKKKRKVYATGRGLFEKGKLYVLIDENTASASEIVAGALQDNDRAVIVGRRSYGKGLVQEEVKLKDGSLMRITTARYFTPSGRSIQRPYKKGHLKEYEADFNKRYYSGELFFKDSIKINDTLQYHTKKGRIVYGGGGIIPDIFVPLDSTYVSDQYHILLLRHSLNKAITGYGQKYYPELIKMSEEDFVSADSIGYGMYQFISGKYGLHDKNTEDRKHILFRNLLHALIARDFFGTSAYYKIRMQVDKMILRILNPPDSIPANKTKDSLRHETISR